MFANLKLVLRSYTSLYGIFTSASLTLFIYTTRSQRLLLLFVFICPSFYALIKGTVIVNIRHCISMNNFLSEADLVSLKNCSV